MLKLTKDREWIAKPHATQKKAASAKVSISQKNYGKSTVEKCGGKEQSERFVFGKFEGRKYSRNSFSQTYIQYTP